MDTQCKTDPRAPHGFLRNASHTENRYVCECEMWEPPEIYYRHIIRKWAAENSNWYPSDEQCDSMLRELGIWGERSESNERPTGESDHERIVRRQCTEKLPEIARKT